MLASHDEGLINESCLQRIYVRFLGHVPTVPRSNILCPPRRIHMHENCTMIGSDHKVDAPHCSHWNSHSVTPCLTCHGAQPCWHWLCIINICATVAITVSLATRNFRVKLLRFEDWTFRETMATPPARFHDRSCSLKLLRRYDTSIELIPDGIPRKIHELSNSRRNGGRGIQRDSIRDCDSGMRIEFRSIVPCFEHTILGEWKTSLGNGLGRE